MRIAVLADIHGNLAALQAVLADVNTQEVDQILFGGDLVMNGPHPAETLALIRNFDAPGVIGNTDVMTVDREAHIAYWTADQIGEDGVNYLKNLPLHHRVQAPGSTDPMQDLLLVHATPRDCFDLLIIEPPPAISTLPQPNSAEEAIEMMAGERADLILFGHIHYESAAVIDGQRLCSIQSVGFPFDGDHRAGYGIVSWDGANWQVEHHRVEYNYAQVAADIHKRGQPNPKRYAGRIREARWMR